VVGTKTESASLVALVVETDTRGSEPSADLAGGTPHVIIRLYSVLKTRLCDGLQGAIGDHTVQEEKQTSRLLKSASREVEGEEK
jgi:hypothetical protein